jgi:hypothetical protein
MSRSVMLSLSGYDLDTLLFLSHLSHLPPPFLLMDKTIYHLPLFLKAISPLVLL